MIDIAIEQDGDEWILVQRQDGVGMGTDGRRWPTFDAAVEAADLYRYAALEERGMEIGKAY